MPLGDHGRDSGDGSREPEGHEKELGFSTGVHLPREATARTDGLGVGVREREGQGLGA